MQKFYTDKISDHETNLIEVRVSEPEISIFSSKLNPHRTQSLVSGYCNEYKYFQIISIDIIKIIVLYFNHITYLNIKKPINYTSTYQSTKCRTRYNNNQILRLLSKYESGHIIYPFWKYNYNFIPPTTMTPNEIIDDIERFKDCLFEIKVTFVSSTNYIDINLTPKEAMKNVNNMVLRIRIFCVQNNKEIAQLINANESSVTTIENVKQLEITSDLFKISKNEIDIGIEIEILHILYKDNSYWAKWHYSLVEDAIKRHNIVNYNEWRKYFDSRCFKINDKHFYLLEKCLYYPQCDEYIYYQHLPEFIQFISYFCEEILSLPYDIIIIDRDYLRFSLRGRFKNGLKQALQHKRSGIKDDFKKALQGKPFYLAAAVRVKIGLKKALQDKKVYDTLSTPLPPETKFDEEEDNFVCDDTKLSKDLNHRRYRYRNKICKMHKSYSNNKKKFRYHRW